jgi:hypothetical protein
MEKIPAASIHDLDLTCVREAFPEIATELIRLGDLLAQGRETADEFLRLIELLRHVGATDKAEELLRCNVVEEGDRYHREYIAMFGCRTTEAFASAIAAFARQFQLSLNRTKSLGVWRFVYRSLPQTPQKIPDPGIARFLKAPADVEFRYESEGTTADIASDHPALAADYLILRFKNDTWLLEFDSLAAK